MNLGQRDFAIAVLVELGMQRPELPAKQQMQLQHLGEFNRGRGALWSWLPPRCHARQELLPQEPKRRGPCLSLSRSQGCDRLVLLASCSSEEGHQPCTALRSAELSEHGTLWASHRKLRQISVNATWPGRFRNWLHCTPMLSVRPGRQDGPGVRKWLWKECGCSSALSQTEALPCLVSSLGPTVGPATPC